jgi:hypothetical protein
MCFAFFVATGSFFMGQQDVLPQVVRGSPVLFVLALAPIALMLFWRAGPVLQADQRAEAPWCRRRHRGRGPTA